MTEAAAAAHGRGLGTGTRLGDIVARATSTDVLIGVALAVLWVLGHPFTGIDGDARIYMGRALADLDPAGVGRDMMFVLDGQSAFTVFRVLAGALAKAFGLGPTVAILTLVNIAAWFSAMVIFVRRVVPGRAAALVLATAFVLPRLYTGWNLLAAGDSVPVPRPLAEAGVLLALAMLCRGRLLACAACLAGAALFHPIMAAPGFGVLLVVLGLRDRRWFYGAAVLAAAVAGAGLLGLPVASRLTATIDPAWRAVLVSRNPYLFVSRWPAETLGPLVVQGVTLALACLWLDRRARVILLASLAIGLAGVAVSALFGDGAFDVLFVQAQLWRALWLPAVLATVAAGVCLWRLPSRGPAGRIALACLALAWLTLDWFPLAPLAAGLAAAALFGIPRLSFPVGRRAVAAAWIICAAVAGIALWGEVSALRGVLHVLTKDVSLTWGTVWSLRLATLPVMLLVLAWWRWPDAPATRIGAGLAVCLGLTLIATRWDSRPPGQAAADAAVVEPDLVAMLARRPGAVLWTEGDEAWLWARRPNWNAPIQGSSIVFSRDLALAWRARSEAVVAAGLAGGNLLTPLSVPAPLAAPRLDHDRIAAFCAKADAPGWIVAPLDRGIDPPSGLGIRVWSPTVARGRLFADPSGIHWRQFDRYAVIPCRDAPADFARTR